MNPTQNQPATGELSPAVVLRGAARYLQSHGWMQGTYYPNGTTSPFPPACLVGAISMAVHGRRTSSPFLADGHVSTACVDAVGVFIDYLHATGQIPAFAVVDDFEDDPAPFDYNDTPGRTADQVIAALLAAADDYERLHIDTDTPAIAGGAR